MIFELHIQETITKLLQQEDTDGDTRITIEDQGIKAFELVDIQGKPYLVKGTYHLSNLLQELVWAQHQGQTTATIDRSRIEEPPANRLQRMIKEHYWDGLTRTMDKEGIVALLQDSKNEALASETLRVYVPYRDHITIEYYRHLEQQFPLEVIQLPAGITPSYVQSLNNAPGILALKLSEKNKEMIGEPFVVPGGRFNEMYGWDSYFEAVGLLLDGRIDLAMGMANNFQYEIEYYGKILNANRSYYLTRTQPPFYSSLIAEIFEQTNNVHWMRSHLATAIKEYETVWMVAEKRLTSNGLNRYLAEGIGKPPEAEEGHFHHEMHRFAQAMGLDVATYERQYSSGAIKNEALDEYFVHDRSVRESGHDTSYRLEGCCAHLNVVELNAFLYKYETDFADLIKNHCDDYFQTTDNHYTSQYWLQKAATRRKLVDQYLWNDEKGMYFDYNIETQSQTHFVSATSLTPLWSLLCSEDQAQKLVSQLIPLLKEEGGIASCTAESRGEIHELRPQKQWDYPNGWAPHQMLIWKGLRHYGYEELLQELVYRWLYMITKNAADYNGTIPEKYDVVAATHKVFAEYGNVGTDFQYITKEGFGWMNASFQYGFSLLNETFITALNQLTKPEDLFE